jgi:PAS domain S-box-containing protein
MTRVLVVDDVLVNRRYLRVLLQGQGCEVEEARHGAEALVKARRQPPDLCITDLLMPVMDGFTLLRHWRADARLGTIPVIVYTATYTAPQDETLVLGLGADAFIVKPAEPEPLIARVREVVAQPHRRDAAPPHRPAGDEARLLETYSEAVVRKLEQKTLQLEQANRDLAAREVRLRAIVDTEPECVKVLAADGALLEMNPAGLRMIEADSFEQIANHSLYPLVADEHRAAFRALTQRVFRGESGTLAFQMTGLKGGRRWLETHAAPLHDASGDITGLLGITRDITEHKRAEEALRESEAKFRALAEESMIGVSVVQDGRFKYVSSRVSVASRSRSMTWRRWTWWATSSRNCTPPSGAASGT